MVENIKKVVRKNYGDIAKKGRSCCTPSDSCCGDLSAAQIDSIKLGYSEEELKSLPEGADLGLGCGNPVAFAELKEGDIYLDLGSGAGIDCFLAAQRIGKTGKAIGVDMTHEMLEKARENAEKGGFDNVEFRLGEIEHLPVADNSVDIITSNCVINLSPDKKAVFEDSFRVLKPGGKLMVSDIVLLKALPDYILKSLDAYVGCVAGAMIKDDYLGLVKDAGFKEVKIISETVFEKDSWINDPITRDIIEKMQVSDDEVQDVANSVVSIKFSATKPK